MKYNPSSHYLRNLRLKGYDYSQAGLYFVPICVQNRACLFCEIHNKKMCLNAAGRMVEKWNYELANKYRNMRCHETIVMPNHFHCILEIVEIPNPDNDNIPDAHVGAPYVGTPKTVKNMAFTISNMAQQLAISSIGSKP